MVRLSTRCIIFVLVVIFVSGVWRSKAEPDGGEVEDEHEFNYEEAGEKGPSNWGKLKAEWEMCGKGTMQSPIDLLNKRVQIVSNLGMLNRDYRPSYASLKNRGHDMMLKFKDGAGCINIGGVRYELRQVHWHSPSEHTINGKRYALEVHMVHENEDERIVVVSMLYRIGPPDNFLQSLEKALQKVTDEHRAEEDVGIIDPKKIKPESLQYYRYIGSLTTPPCTQNVTWTVLSRMRTVTKEQLELLRVAVHDESDSNARPVQPSNERQIYLYKPK